MTNKKISELTQATQVGDSDELVVVQSGITKKVTKQSLQESLSVESGTTINLETKGTMDNTLVSDFSKGNSDFNVGGILGGGIGFDTVTQLRGKQSFLYTSNATAGNSTNDWISRSISVPLGYRGKQYELKFQFTNEFASGNVKIKVLDSSGTLLLERDLPNYESIKRAKEFSSQFFVGAEVTTLVWGFHVINGESSKSIKIDDVIVTPTINTTQEVVLSEEQNSMIRLIGGNSQGSTNTHIKRFSTIDEQFGSAITYQDSATLGASFTIEKDGFYAISYMDVSASATDQIGISKNSTQLTTNIYNINNADRLAYDIPGSASQLAEASWAGFLNRGDVIRAHGTNTLTDNSKSQFTISFVAPAHVLPVFKDQKIEIPTSYLRYEQVTGRTGTIIQFTNLTNIVGSSLSVNNTSGTHITVNKAGIVTVSVSTRFATGGNSIWISKNQSNLAVNPTDSEIIVSTTNATNNYAISATASFLVKVGDVIRIAANGTPTTGSGAQSFLSVVHVEQEVAVAVNSIEPQYEETDTCVSVIGGNGSGSTYPRIRRFSSVESNLGSDVTYVPSATLGDSFIINTDGIYSISYNDRDNTTARDFGISRNASSLTSSITALQLSEVLALSTSSTNTYSETLSWTGKLLAGDVIRCQSGVDNAPNGTTVGVRFTITKQAKPSIIGIDGRPIDAYVQQPDSRLRLITGSGSDTFLNFSTVDVISGGAISFTAPNQININEDGEYYFSGTLYLSNVVNISFLKNTTTYSAFVNNPDVLYSNSFSDTTSEYEGFAFRASLKKGDVIRGIGHVAFSHASAGVYSFLEVGKIGDVIRAVPMIDSTVPLRVSEIEMYAASGNLSYGSTNTRIVEYDVVRRVKGDGLTVSNTDGTFITAQKDGVITITANVVQATDSDMAIYRNPTDTTSLVATNPNQVVALATQINNAWSNFISWSGEVKAGDTFAVALNNGITSGRFSLLNAVLIEKDISVTISNVSPQFEDVDSMIRLHTTNGYGSIATRIRRWASIKEIKGSAITYIDSAEYGSSFIANENGLYSISYTDSFSTTHVAGISLNSTQLSTDFHLINVEDKLAASLSGGAQYEVHASWTGYLRAGDVIRCHVEGPTAGTANRAQFTMTKMALPSIAEVDVTPFADLTQKVYKTSPWEKFDMVVEGTSSNPSLGTYIYNYARKRRMGDSMEIEWTYIQTGAGTAGSGTYLFKIPDNELIDASKIVISGDTSIATLIGHGEFNNSSSKTLNAKFWAYDSNHIYGAYESAIGSFSGIGSGVPLSTANWRISFRVLVPIQGWEVYEDSHETVYAVEDNENVFSAKITNDGSTAALVSQSSPFISSVVRDSLGQITVNFIPGFFGETPAVHITNSDNGTTTGLSSVWKTASVSAVVIGTGNDAVTWTDRDLDILVQRQGSDYRDLQRQIVALKEFPKVNNQLTQHIQHLANGNTLLEASGEIRFNTANLTTAGDSILSIIDDVGNTRTKFTALKNCIVGVHFSGVCANTSELVQVYKNGLLVARGSQTFSGANYYSSVDTSLKLLEGDYVTVVINGGSIASTTNPCLLNLVAQAQELKSVSNLEGGENTFSAQISNAGALLSESSPFIQSITGSSGDFTINFKPGFFSAAPHVVASVNHASTNSYVVYPHNITTSSCDIRTQYVNAVNGDIPFTIVVQRQGADYRDPQELIIQLEDFPRVNRTLKQNISYNQNFATLTNASEELEYNISLLEYSGDSLVLAVDDSANTRTKFVALKKCRVTATTSGALSGTNSYTYIKKNDVIIANGSHVRTSGDASGATVSTILNVGDYLTFGFSPSAISTNLLSIVAETEELERVDNIDLVENVHTVTVQAGTSNVIARNTDFLTVTRTGPGTYNVTYAYALTAQPAVVVTCLNTVNETGTSGLSNYGYAHNFTANGFSYKIGYENGEGGDGGFLQDRNHSVAVYLQGTDYKSVQDIVVAMPEAKTKWQRKVLESNVTTDINPIPSLTFNNLELGKTYRCSLTVNVYSTVSDTAIIYAVHDGADIEQYAFIGNGNDGDKSTLVFIFIATNTSLTFRSASVGAGTVFYGTGVPWSSTHVVLEELPLHEQTNQWT